MTGQTGPLIYSKMAAILAKVDAIGKEQKNVQQGFQYRGIDDVYNALNPVLAEHGVFMTSEIVAKSREERTNNKGTVLAFTCLRIRYTFWAEDGSHVWTEVEGEGMDSGDKSSNKAMAVAHKYALLQAFCIPTKDLDDPDAETHEIASKSQAAAQSIRGRVALGGLYVPRGAPVQKEEPAHVREAKDILAKAAKITDLEEFGAFFDGVQPRLADIKKASENTYNHVIARLGERDAELRLAP